ncbi:hypothetical protein Tco_1080410 [Tanacetum coccineum]|uniref:Uncharacterized protein n=1 Tax=Tanacetum coccineum TaxID=301880 RepID=A0ABQ5HV49_9ASTR
MSRIIVVYRECFVSRQDESRRDYCCSTMRIPFVYILVKSSQCRERFMNYLEEQTDEEAMINLYSELSRIVALESSIRDVQSYDDVVIGSMTSEVYYVEEMFFYSMIMMMCGKLKVKMGEIGVFVGYSKESAAYRVYNKRNELEALKDVLGSAMPRRRLINLAR